MTSEMDMAIKKAYLRMNRFLTKQAKIDFVDRPYAEDPQMASWIRLRCLEPGSSIYKTFCDHGINDKVEISYIIMEGYYQSLKKKTSRKNW